MTLRKRPCRDAAAQIDAHATGLRVVTTGGMRPKLVLLAAAVVACTDPGIPPSPGVAPLSIASTALSPPRQDGRTAPVVRVTLAFSTAAPLDTGMLDRVVLVAGGADEADVAALAKNRVTAALRAREVPVVTWIARAAAPGDADVLHVQPSRPLPAGRSTLVVLPQKRPPLTVALDVADDGPEIAKRLWASHDVVTFCASELPRELEPFLELAPDAKRARVRRLPGVPCFDAIAETPPIAALFPPVVAGGRLALDPSPVTSEPRTPRRPEPPCPAGSVAIDVLCVRVEDDRLVVYGGVDTPRLLLGTIAERPIVAPLSTGARFLVRGLAPSSPVRLDLSVRDASGERRVARTLTSRAARRHVVVNEILVRPPSGAASQRFIELVNDGDGEVDLAGLVVSDGDAEWELVDGTLPAGGFALITPDAWVDGLGGEIAPPRGPLRFFVEKLSLTSGVAIVEPDGTVLSRFPPTTSTRTVARGRRSPDRPDDAPDAFGWDAAGRATPGLPNVIAP